MRRELLDDLKILGFGLLGAALVADFCFATVFFDDAWFENSGLSDSDPARVVGWILWIGACVVTLIAVAANYLNRPTNSWIEGVECTNCGKEVQPEDLRCFGCGLVFDEEIECGYCGASVDGQSNFCRACGKEFGGPSCAHCEEAINPEDLFCRHCGKSVPGSKT